MSARAPTARTSITIAFFDQQALDGEFIAEILSTVPLGFRPSRFRLNGNNSRAPTDQRALAEKARRFEAGAILNIEDDESQFHAGFIASAPLDQIFLQNGQNQPADELVRLCSSHHAFNVAYFG